MSVAECELSQNRSLILSLGPAEMLAYRGWRMLMTWLAMSGNTIVYYLVWGCVWAGAIWLLWGLGMWLEAWLT